MGFRPKPTRKSTFIDKRIENGVPGRVEMAQDFKMVGVHIVKVFDSDLTEARSILHHKDKK